MAILHKLFLGLNDKDTKIQHESIYENKQRLIKIMQSVNLDCTITEGDGIYTHDDPTQIVENCLIVDILDFDGTAETSVRALAELLKRKFNQESVGYQAVTLDKCELL